MVYREHNPIRQEQCANGASPFFQVWVGGFDPLVEDAHGAGLRQIAVISVWKLDLSPRLGVKN